jgi:hypothetical protein
MSPQTIEWFVGAVIIALILLWLINNGEPK